MLQNGTKLLRLCWSFLYFRTFVIQLITPNQTRDTVIIQSCWYSWWCFRGPIWTGTCVFRENPPILTAGCIPSQMLMLGIEFGPYCLEARVLIKLWASGCQSWMGVNLSVCLPVHLIWKFAQTVSGEFCVFTIIITACFKF